MELDFIGKETKNIVSGYISHCYVSVFNLKAEI